MLLWFDLVWNLDSTLNKIVLNQRWLSIINNTNRYVHAFVIRNRCELMQAYYGSNPFTCSSSDVGSREREREWKWKDRSYQLSPPMHQMIVYHFFWIWETLVYQVRFWSSSFIQLGPNSFINNVIITLLTAQTRNQLCHKRWPSVKS